MTVQPVAATCPACRDGVGVRGVLAYRKIYLCTLHRAAHDRELARVESREQQKQVPL